MNYDKLMVASYLGGCAVANSNVGICHPVSYGLSKIRGFRHGFAVCVVFNQLQEYYPEVEEFQEIMRRHEVQIPPYLLNDVSEEQIAQMIDATLKNEKPLENAFGENWRTIFSREKVREILLRI